MSTITNENGSIRLAGRPSEKTNNLCKIDTNVANSHREGELRSSTSSTFDSSSSLTSLRGKKHSQGWVTSPQLPDGWTSRSTLDSYASPGSPITSIDSHDELSPIDLEANPFSPVVESMADVLQRLPIRLKSPTKDSQAVQDAQGHNQLAKSHSVKRWQESCPQTPIQRPVSDVTPVPSSPISTRSSDKKAKAGAGEAKESGKTTEASEQGASITERLLKEALTTAFGIDPRETRRPLPTSRSVVRNFLSDLSWAIELDDAGIRQAAGLERLPTNGSGSPSGARSSRQSSTKSDKGKRKGRGSRKNDGNDDDFDEDEPEGSGEPSPAKRARLEPTIRMSCPYRKKNPLRFNVRDHRLCALTVFTDIAELRRHIQDCHRRPSPSLYSCLRCRAPFPTEDDLRHHQLYINGLCPVNHADMNCQNAEDGIDQEIADKLRSKKGRVADPVEVQWQKMWDLLFPGTLVQPYDYCAVMEHHELHEKLQSTLPVLLMSLSQVGLTPRGLETLGSILSNHFIDLLEQCNHEGRQKEYRNRQPKAQQSPSGRLRVKQSSLRRRLGAAHRDSGVDVGFVDSTNNAEYAGGNASMRRSADVSSSVQTTPLLYQDQASYLLEDIPELLLGGSSWGPPATQLPDTLYPDTSFGHGAPHLDHSNPILFPSGMSQEAGAQSLLAQGSLTTLPVHPHDLQALDLSALNSHDWIAQNWGGVSNEGTPETRQ